jgi:Flp pilus assembly CpaF family ATPase
MIWRRAPARPPAALASPVRSTAPAHVAATVDAVRERLVTELPARAALELARQPATLAAIISAWTAACAPAADTAAALAADLCGAGPLEPLLADDRVTEIMVAGTRRIHVEVDGRLVPTDLAFRDSHHLRAVVDRMVAATGRRLDEATPAVDAVLADGTRLNAVLPPVAVDGPYVTLRRPRGPGLRFADLVRAGSLPRLLATFLHAAVLGRCNLIVSGGTGAGKTTLLAALCALVPAEQRIVTIEDVAELRVEHPHVAAQQCRESPSAGAATLDMRALVRNTLRMRPDRIVVGEVRGPEAADMVAAMNTGHPGSMSTVHANSALDSLSRIEGMLAMAWPALSMSTLRTWVSDAVDVIVHCERDTTGRRAVTEVVTLGDAGPLIIYDASCADPPLVRRPDDRCLARMARHGVDFAPEILTRPHVA